MSTNEQWSARNLPCDTVEGKGLSAWHPLCGAASPASARSMVPGQPTHNWKNFPLVFTKKKKDIFSSFLFLLIFCTFLFSLNHFFSDWKPLYKSFFSKTFILNKIDCLYFAANSIAQFDSSNINILRVLIPYAIKSDNNIDSKAIYCIYFRVLSHTVAYSKSTTVYKA